MPQRLTETKTTTVMLKGVRPMNRALGISLLLAAILAGFPTTGSGAQTIFFAENFDNSNFASRGWYDSNGGVIDTSVYSPGGGNSSIRFSFAQGATGPTGGSPRRILFTASESVYISFWVKLGTASVTWQGSGVSFHPHVIHLLTDAEPNPAGGLAVTQLTFYIEWNLFTPRLAMQDGQRINLSQLTNSYPGLLGSTTTHAVAGGNGPQNQATPTVAGYYCFSNCASGTPIYTNGTDWDSASANANLVNNTWHHVEAYVAMNSISGGVPQADGVIKYWVDGTLVIDRTNVYLRTAQYANQKFNQFMIAPYIGNGSPIDQDMWIDNLIVADQRTASQTGVPAPTNLRVIP